MKNKYVISSLTALSAISTASCNYGMKTNIKYFELGIGGGVLSFLESASYSLFGVHGSMQGYIARNNGICGMIDGCASWSRRSTFNPSFPIVNTGIWMDSTGLKGYVFDGDIALGKDFCFSDAETIRHHRAKDHYLNRRIGVGIDIGGRKTTFKNKDTGDVQPNKPTLTNADTHSLFVGAKCKMMYPMDNALLIFDIKAGPVVYGKGEYAALQGAVTAKEKLKSEQNIGAEVKAYISGIYSMSNKDFVMGMKVSVDYNYRTEEVKENSTVVAGGSAAIFATAKDAALDGAFSNNILGTIELVFAYCTV